MNRVLVDADVCSAIRIVERIAKAHGVHVTLLCDTNHVLASDYSEEKVSGAGTDAVDFVLINLCRRGDIVITQDYGVEALALDKGTYTIHQSGRLYRQDNIDRMRMERHLVRQARMGKGKHHVSKFHNVLRKSRIKRWLVQNSAKGKGFKTKSVNC